MVLLRFIYLTLPNCAGKLLKALSKEEKQENKYKKAKDEQKGTFTRPQCAPNSQWRVTSARNRQRGTFTRPQLAMTSYQRNNIGRSTVLLAMASEVTWEAS